MRQPETSAHHSWNIRFEDLTLGYDGKIVLKDINATLPSGKISFILGSSGGGKSTLLRHMVGLRRPISGKIWLGEYDIFSMRAPLFKALRRRMGMLFQDGALLGALTLEQNIALPLQEHTSLSSRLIDEVTLRTLDMVGLAEYASYYPNQLSGGMRKRAGLARAMITSPPILLCDEPTSGLDPINSAQMDNLILFLKQQNPDMTIVVVSHDIQSLYALAEHVLVFHGGGMVFNGSMEELKTSGNSFLRKFVNRDAAMADRETQHRFSLSPQKRAILQEALDQWLEKK